MNNISFGCVWLVVTIQHYIAFTKNLCPYYLYKVVKDWIAINQQYHFTFLSQMKLLQIKTLAIC